MKRFSTLITFAFFLLAHMAHAHVTVLAVPLKDSGDALAALSRHPLVLRAEPVFDPAESSALSELGASELVSSAKLTLKSDADVAVLKDWAKKRSLAVEIQKNAAVMTLSDPFSKYQWGLANTGKSQRLRLDDLTTISFPVRSGEDIGVTRAPPESTDPAKRVIVAVLDSGIDYDHPDLAGHILTKPDECKALQESKDCLTAEAEACKTVTDPVEHKSCLTRVNKPVCDAKWANFDSDKNGYPMDCHGWNVTAERNPITQIIGNEDASDDRGHGTHVAGIIAAAANDLGVRGVAQNVAILPVKVVRDRISSPVNPQSADDGSSNSRSTEDDPLPLPQEVGKVTAGFVDLVARGMLYAIRSNARVMNLSLAWPVSADSLLMRKMVELAQRRGIVVVAAAGNDSTEARVLPCAYPGVICVASHGPDGALSHFSNYGPAVDIAAPGLNILSTWPTKLRTFFFTEREGFDYDNGTSMSSPFVAGAVARLLGAGYSGDEAFARLMLGARPSQTSTLASPLSPEKYIQSGNADLARAFEVRPQPLILPASKWPMQLEWDGHAKALPFKVVLKNIWSAARNVRLSARGVSEGSSVSGGNWTLDSWDAGEIKTLDGNLEILDSRLDSEVTLEFTVSSDGVGEKRFRVSADILIPVSASTAETLGGTSFSLEGAPVSKTASLRSINELDQKPFRDYLAVEKGNQEWSLQLLRQSRDSVTEKTYVAGNPVKMAAVHGEILSIQRLDTEQTGGETYAVLIQIQGVPRPVYRLEIFDPKLNLLRKVDYDNKASMMPDSFKWLKISEEGHDRLVPAWVGIGTVPPLDKPPFDPWDPNPSDDKEGRLYYLGSDGLHSINPPKDLFFVQMMIQTPAQQEAGRISVILGSGTDFRIAYSMAELQGREVKQVTSFELPDYRMLFGLDNVLPVVPVDAKDPLQALTGTAFGGAGIKGAQRMTWIRNSQDPSKVFDLVMAPTTVTDSVYRFAAVFSKNSSPLFFAQTHYDLQYEDAATGQIALTSAHRFSFLPASVFQTSLFPVQVAGSRADENTRIPGLMTPEGLGYTAGLEVVVPSYDSNGSLKGLIRPARLHFSAAEACDELANPIPATESAPSQVTYFCGDRFVRLPLAF